MKLLADDLFRVAHDDYTGKPRLNAHSAALGLAAALLAELLATKHINVEDTKLTVVSNKPPPDALVHAILDQLIAESQSHPLRVWLQFFATESTTRVAGRLQRAGHLRQARTGGFLRKQTVWEPTDPNKAGAPAAVLTVALREYKPIDPYWAWLAGLCLASGLHTRLLDGAPAESGAYLQHVVDGVWQPMHALLHHTSAVIAGTALTPTV